ncbi:hypothetical protein ES702_01954 [subsurface metagenome]
MAIEILLDLDEPAISSLVWELLLDNGYKISRASVIFFLNDLVDEGLVKWEDGTGKGGHHKLYYIVTRDKVELFRMVSQKFIFKLWEIFPEVPELNDAMRLLAGDREE